MTGALAARRAATLERFGSHPFDLLIVGGGATGAATARDAALRGLDVGLCDAGDFAGETSSQSSKLIHGGIRYLQYGDFHLVFEGLRERRHLMHTAPHLCRPIEFLFPGYSGERPGLSALGVGVELYNALALWRPPATRGRKLAARELYDLAPHLRTAGLVGAIAYRDCQTDDARLVLENVLDAEAAGATVANHLRAEAIRRDRRGRVIGAALVDVETGARLEVRARLVLSATGPFTDSFVDGASHRLRPTLGVHLVFDAARVPHQGRALVLRSPRDNRLFFALPAGARTIIGTTDTDWTSNLPPRLDDEIRARGEDVTYLLEAANHAFPRLRLVADDVLSTYAGLRPLLATSANTPSETSREHDIARAADGLLVVAGGKLTTLRRMGEEAVDRSIEALHAAGFERPLAACATAERPLPGGGSLPAALEAARLPPDVSAHLASAYGGRAGRVLELAASSADLAKRIDPELPYLWAEALHAVRFEHARAVADVLRRRIPLFRDGRDQGLDAAERIAVILAAELGWSPDERGRALRDYQSTVDRSRRWRAELTGS